MRIISNYPIKYQGNIIWPILLILIYFPAGILLLLSGLRVKKDAEYYGFHYKGSVGWLIFWTIVLFPVALILALLNGVDFVACKDDPYYSYIPKK